MISEEYREQKLSLEEMLDWLDMQLMYGHAADDDSELNPSSFFRVWYVGWPQELNAGIYGGSATPSFRTVNELEAWMQQHWKELWDEHVKGLLD